MYARRHQHERSPLADTSCFVCKELGVRELVGLQVRHHELCLVVEHLLKVRHVPVLVNAVAMEATACV